MSESFPLIHGGASCNPVCTAFFSRLKGSLHRVEAEDLEEGVHDAGVTALHTGRDS